jgi:hypothetical protein
MNGNVDNKGIKLDLEWMHRVGIGGVHIFDVDLGTARCVAQPAEFMSPRWLESVRYTTAEARKLGMEVAVAGGSGWSESGGPWVTPQQGMKKYVWTETKVDGPRRFSGTLAAPPLGQRPVQNIPIHRQSDFAPMPDGSPGGQRTAAEIHPCRSGTPMPPSSPIACRMRKPPRQRVPSPPAAAPSTPHRSWWRFRTCAKAAAVAGGRQAGLVQIEYAQPVRAQAVTLSIGGTNS